MKRVYPQNTQNYISVPQLEDQIKGDQNTTIARFHQSTISKGPLSLVPSEANQSFYQIIEKNKLCYLESYGQFTEMKFMENLAGLKSKQYKASLLESFFNMYDDMIQNLVVIQNTLLQINFDAPDFEIIYDSTPQNLLDVLYKDIKTIEGIHLEIVYSSSLRFLETVLEAQQMNLDYVARLYQIDIKQWAQKSIAYLQQFNIALQRKKESKSCCSCFN